MAAESTLEIVPEDSKDPQALFEQATRFEKGDGVHKDLGVAAQYYFRAAQLNSKMRQKCFERVSAMETQHTALQYHEILNTLGRFFMGDVSGMFQEPNKALNYFLRTYQLLPMCHVAFNISLAYRYLRCSIIKHDDAAMQALGCGWAALELSWAVLAVLYGYKKEIKCLQEHLKPEQHIVDFAKSLLEDASLIQDFGINNVNQKISARLEEKEKHAETLAIVQALPKEKLDEPLESIGSLPLHHMLEINENDSAVKLIDAGAKAGLPAGGDGPNKDKTGWELAKKNNHVNVTGRILQQSHSIVAARIKEKKQLNEPLDTTGEPALISMVDMDNPLALQLIDLGARLDIRSRSQATLLHLATERNNKTFLERLAKTRLQTWGNAQDERGATALHDAAHYGHLEAMEILCNLYYASPFIADHQGNTPLHLAAAAGRNNTCEFLLKATAAEINAVNEDGNTPLHRAILARHFELARMLLANGANPNIENKKKKSPCQLDLYSVTQVFGPFIKQHQQMLNKLREKLDWLRKNSGKEDSIEILVLVELEKLIQQNRNTPWQIIINTFKDMSCYNALLVSRSFTEMFSTNYREEIKRFLAEEVISPAAVYRGDMKATWLASTNLSEYSTNDATALLYAAQYGHLDSMEIFCNFYNVSPSTADHQGNTPLHLAAAAGRNNTCEFLLKATVADINAVNKDGNTPLHLAILAGHIELARILLANGANPNIENKDQKSPCQLDLNNVNQVFCPFIIQNQKELNKLREKLERLRKTSEKEDSIEIRALVELEILIQQNLNTPWQVIINTFKEIPHYKELLTPRNFIERFSQNYREEIKRFLTEEVISPATVYRCDMKATWLALTNPSVYSTSVTSSNFWSGPPLEKPEFVLRQPTSSSSSSTPQKDSEIVDSKYYLHELIKLDDTSLKDVVLIGIGLHRSPFTDHLGRTLFHVSAYYNRRSVLPTLFETGFLTEIDSRNRFGNTAFSAAAAFGHREFMSDLYKAGSKGHLIPNHCGETPLHLAAQFGRQGVCSDLLAIGVDVNQKNKKGDTPLHIAVRESKSEIVEMLLLHDADPYIQNEKGLYPWEAGVDSMATAVFQTIQNRNWEGITAIKAEMARLSSQNLLEPMIEEHFLLLEALLKGPKEGSYVPISANMTLFKSLKSFVVLQENYPRQAAILNAFLNTHISPTYRQHFPGGIPPQVDNFVMPVAASAPPFSDVVTRDSIETEATASAPPLPGSEGNSTSGDGASNNGELYPALTALH